MATFAPFKGPAGLTPSTDALHAVEHGLEAAGHAIKHGLDKGLAKLHLTAGHHQSLHEALKKLRVRRTGPLAASSRLSAVNARSTSVYDTVPCSASEVSAYWMGRALVEAGVVGKPTDVRDVEVKPVAAQGYLSDTVRVKLAYAAGCAGPASVIVKLPQSNDAQLEAAAENHAYELEFQFYSELWAKLQQAEVPMAVCLHAAVDAERDLWVLILEDLTLRGPGWRAGDQVGGMSADEMEAGCVSLARMHAAFWGAEGLPGWVPTTNSCPLTNVVHAVEKNWAAYRTSAWPEVAKISPEAMQAAEAVAANVQRLAAMLEEAPQTLVHHDARPDNLFFGSTESGATEAVLLDWQLIGKGKGPIDVARLLICNFDPATGPSAVVAMREMVRIYHRELCCCLAPAAASAYPFEACWRDYRIGAAWLLWQGILFAPGSPFTCDMDDPTSRTTRLFTIMNRHVAWLAELEVTSLFD